MCITSPRYFGYTQHDTVPWRGPCINNNNFVIASVFSFYGLSLIMHKFAVSDFVQYDTIFTLRAT